MSGRLNDVQTMGDQPVDIDDYDTSPERMYEQKQDQQFTSDQNQMLDYLQSQQQQQQQQPQTRYSQELSMTSLSQLMGKATPQQFAKQFVYGDQKKLIKSVQRQNTYSGRENQLYSSVNANKTSDLIQRFTSPQQRNFGDELQQNANATGPSKYTKYSQQIRESFKKRPNERAFTATKDTDILLSPKFVSSVKNPTQQNDSQMQTQKDHGLKLTQEHEIFKQKKEILREKYAQEEMSQCSFTPAINRKRNDIYDKNRFYNYMDKKKIELMEKNNRLKDQLNKQEVDTLQDKPQISGKTQKLAVKSQMKSGSSSHSIVERLFTQQGTRQTTQGNSEYYDDYQNESKKQNLKTVADDPECTFKPYVSEISTKLAENKMRHGTIDYQLYEDAKKRHEKQIIQEQNERGPQGVGSKKSIEIRGSQLGGFMHSQKNLPQKSTYNDTQNNKITVQANIDRFKKEFETAYYAIVRGSSENLNAEQNLWNQKLTYYEVVEMMKVMYFLNPSPTEDWISSLHNSSVALAQKAWFQLFGKKNNYIISRNLLVFLFAVQNINVPKDQIEKIDDSKEGDYNTDEQDEININDQDNEQQQYSRRISHLNEHESEKQQQTHSHLTNQDNHSSHEEQAMKSSHHTQSSPSKQISEQQQSSHSQKNLNQQQQQQQQQHEEYIAQELPPDERPQEHFSPHRLQRKLQNQEQSDNEKIFMEKLNRIQDVPRHVGYYDSLGNLYLTEKNTLDIHRVYYPLYITKLSMQKGATHYRKISKQTAIQPEQPTYKPQISKISQQIAQNKRERIVDHLKAAGNHVSIDLNTILCFQKQQAEDEKKILRHQFEDEQLDNCTFKPSTKSYNIVSSLYKRENEFEDQYNENKKNQITSTKPSGIHRTEELYRLAKPHNQRRDRDREEIEYEKGCDECTFQPDIFSNKSQSMMNQQQSYMFMTNQNNTQQQNNTIVSPMKTMNQSQLSQPEIKNIERVKRARVKKQMENEIKSKGITQNKQSLRKMQDQYVNKMNNSQKSQKVKRKAPLNNGGNWAQTSRSPNSSSFMKPGNNMSQPNYYENYRNDTAGSQEDDIKYIQQQMQNERSPKDFQDNILDQGNSPTQLNSQPPSVPQTQKTAEDDKVPLLFVDVNIEEGKTARIIVYEDDRSEDLATRFTQEHGLDPSMKSKLKDMLDQQINSLLTKIDEEAISDSSSTKN